MVDIESDNWHVMTKSRGGTVSLIKNVTLRMAVEVVKRVTPIAPPNGTVIYGELPKGEIIQTEILGPPGWDGCDAAAQHDWHEIEPYVNGDFRVNYAKCTHCNRKKVLSTEGTPPPIAPRLQTSTS